jgi:hypothetical protein
MIRYEYDREWVETEIRKADPKWFQKAEKRTRDLVVRGGFAEKSSIWSTVKPTFIRLQRNKCVFCERQFASPDDYGTIEFDVEHFRPKSSVTAWPDPARHPKLNYAFQTGLPSPSGYYWLAYELQNYAASCKICNTPLKLNYFPIAGARGTASASIRDLSDEQPFLCYPLGDLDDDPEELVTFDATVAIPAASMGAKHWRGQIIIDFFGLNDREDLHRARAQMIALFGPALQAVSDGRDSHDDRKLISRMQSPDLPHAGCIRAFKRLWSTDEARARQDYVRCRALAVSEIGIGPSDL